MCQWLPRSLRSCPLSCFAGRGRLGYEGGQCACQGWRAAEGQPVDAIGPDPPPCLWAALKRFCPTLARAASAPAGLWQVVVILAGIAAPLPTQYVSDMEELKAAWQPPAASHWLGTDKFGRDLQRRLIYGKRIALSVSSISISISVLCGMTLGVAAARIGGWFYRAVTTVVDLTWSLPEILIALFLVAIIGPARLGQWWRSL